MKKILQFVEKLVKSKLKDNSLKIMETFNSRNFVKKAKILFDGGLFFGNFDKKYLFVRALCARIVQEKIKVFGLCIMLAMSFLTTK